MSDTNREQKLIQTYENMKKVRPEPENDFWETDIETIDACGTSPESVDVGLSPLVTDKIRVLMEKYERMEWLAYLTGWSSASGVMITIMCDLWGT